MEFNNISEDLLSDNQLIVQIKEAGSSTENGNFEDSNCGHKHYSGRSPWIRAALLGANDGLVSIASLMIGIGAVSVDSNTMLISGLSGWIAGACSMAIGEYVSVCGQRDTEEADIQKERREFSKGEKAVRKELVELAEIYHKRGLSVELALMVAEELHRVDPIKAHARDELGIDMDDLSNPVQAAVVSAFAFSCGALIPLLSASFILKFYLRMCVLIATSTVGFALTGSTGAWLGGARVMRASVRAVLGGWMAMAVTYGVLRAFGSSGIA